MNTVPTRSTNEKPTLLVCDKLVDPITEAVKQIRALALRAKTAGQDEVLLHGITALALAHFEVSLSESLKYFLRHFPDKLKGDSKFTKDQLLAEQFFMVEEAIDKIVMKITYNNFAAYLKSFAEITSIKVTDTEEQAIVQEFRARRNLLIHNRLIVNDSYLECAGDLRSTTTKGDRLYIYPSYLVNALAALCTLMENLNQRLAEKYCHYNKIFAAKALWAYLFHSPVMPFDDFWHYDTEKDCILAYKKSSYESGLSRSEKLLLGLWRSHFSGADGHISHINMKHLDHEHQAKVLHFLKWASDFSFS